MRRSRAFSYEEPLNLEPSIANNLPRSPTYEMAKSLEAEQMIYNTPCEGEESMGPIYYSLLSNEQKIYEEFEGKQFRKLHHNELT